METRLEVSIGGDPRILTFTRTMTVEEDVLDRYPSWPWPDLAHALGFFDDVIRAVDNEVKRFIENQPAPRVITMRFCGNGETIILSPNHCRCANAWLTFTTDAARGVLTMELHRVPGSYKDFVLADALDHLEGRAGRGRNRYVDGRPGVLRQKLWHALERGPFVAVERPSPTPIPEEELIRPVGK